MPKKSKFYSITFQMSAPICFIDRPIFDALIVYCWMKEKYGNVPVQLELSDEELSKFPGLPIDYHRDGYPISSIMMFDTGDYVKYNGSWKKRWANKQDDLADFGKTQRKVHTGKGAFKSYDMPLPLHKIPEVTFYFQGNAADVKYFIDRHLSGIGKKISQGYGFFESYEIREAHRQTFDDILMRPIPISSAMYQKYPDNADYRIKYCGYRPSYYLDSNMAKCIYPNF